jgi:hypothetical protein
MLIYTLAAGLSARRDVSNLHPGLFMTATRMRPRKADALHPLAALIGNIVNPDDNVIPITLQTASGWVRRRTFHFDARQSS